MKKVISKFKRAPLSSSKKAYPILPVYGGVPIGVALHSAKEGEIVEIEVSRNVEAK